MAEVRYGHYREYFDQRVAANNAIMAFLAGSHLAAHTLRPVQGSDLLLPQVFPQVPHIARFNLRTDDAIRVLAAAEDHLGYMAVPYVLAIHEDYIVTGALDLLVLSGHLSRTRHRETKSHNMHENLEAATGSRYTAESLALFHLLRLMRNALIHAAGRVSQSLADHRRDLDPTSIQLWSTLTGEQLPQLELGDAVAIRQAEIVAVLALTKRLARETNAALTSTLPRTAWADMAVADAMADRGNLGNPHQAKRILQGTARHYYEPLGLTDAELMAAAGRRGLAV